MSGTRCATDILAPPKQALAAGRGKELPSVEAAEGQRAVMAEILCDGSGSQGPAEPLASGLLLRQAKKRVSRKRNFYFLKLGLPRERIWHVEKMPVTSRRMTHLANGIALRKEVIWRLSALLDQFLTGRTGIIKVVEEVLGQLD